MIEDFIPIVHPYLGVNLLCIHAVLHQHLPHRQQEPLKLLVQVIRMNYN